MIKCNEEEAKTEDFDKAFKREYKNEFGFLLESRIMVDDVKVAYDMQLLGCAISQLLH